MSDAPTASTSSHPPFSHAHAPSQPAPTVTYRHLLSPQTLNPSNPLRVVAHADLDAAYAQFERKRLSLGPESPIVVQQWQGLIAISYPARAYGITRHENVTEARKKCPDLVAVHVATYKQGAREAGYWDETPRPETHKVSLDPYRREGAKVLKCFQETFPSAEIEKASIDEAYLDLTQPVREVLLSRFPYLSSAPPASEGGLDAPLPPPPPVSWNALGNLVPTPQEDADGEEAEERRVDGWEDVALALGAELMRDGRARLWERLEYTCSAGIASNKILAKLCSAWKKPNNQTILRNAAINSFLVPMPFQKIRLLGGKLGDSIAKEYEAQTVSDLWVVDLEEMQRRFGEESVWVWNALRGINYDEVKEKVATKSMLASKNLRPSARSLAALKHWLSVLSAELALRLAEARTDVPTLWPKTLVLHVRQGFAPARSRQTAFPFVRELTAEVVRTQGEKLLRELVGEQKGTLDVSNVSLGFAGLEALEQGQRGIEGFFAPGAAAAPSQPRPTSPPSKPDSTSKAKARRSPSPSLPPPPKRKKGIGAFFDSAPASTSSASSSSTTGPAPPTDTNPGGSSSSYACPRCSVVLVPPAEPELKDEMRAEALEALRLEHEDWHFARDLAEDEKRAALGAATGMGEPKKKKKEKEKPKGIAAFFKPASGSAK